MDEDLGYFLDLRLRLQGRSEAIAIVDHCIRLIARAACASPGELSALEGEVEDLRVQLESRFGPRGPVRIH